jgi:hypothetical protein
MADRRPCELLVCVAVQKSQILRVRSYEVSDTSRPPHQIHTCDVWCGGSPGAGNANASLERRPEDPVGGCNLKDRRNLSPYD